MHAQLRSRFLIALGLPLTSGALVACSSTRSNPKPPDAREDAGAPTLATVVAPPSSTASASDSPLIVAVPSATAPPLPTQDGAWIPPEPPPNLTAKKGKAPEPYPLGVCPSGRFCRPEPITGSPVTPAPGYTRCEAVGRHPDDPAVGPEGKPLGAHPWRHVSFDPTTTASERAKRADACCYTWYSLCPGGRGWRVAGELRHASGIANAAWLGGADPSRSAAAKTEPPTLGGGRDGDLAVSLTADERALLAAHWRELALAEHASVAAFARHTLELLQLGAPPELVAGAQRASLDEVDHAERCFALASQFAGTALGPGPLDVGGLAPRSVDEIAVDTFVEGCVSETVAALEAEEALAEVVERLGLGGTDWSDHRTNPSTAASSVWSDHRTNPSNPVATTLARIAADEARHAELGWRTLAYLLPRCADVTVARLRDVLAQLAAATPLHVAPTTPGTEALRAHGLPDALTRARSRQRALREVIAPCLDALLATRPAPALARPSVVGYA